MKSLIVRCSHYVMGVFPRRRDKGNILSFNGFHMAMIVVLDVMLVLCFACIAESIQAITSACTEWHINSMVYSVEAEHLPGRFKFYDMEVS